MTITLLDQNESAMILQACFRTALVQKKLVKEKAAIETLQACIRASLQAPLQKRSVFEELEAQQDSDLVTSGSGEWIVRQKTGDELTTVDLTIYTKVRMLLDANHPVKWVQTASLSVYEEGIRKMVAEACPDVRLTFIPKLLYDFTAIKWSIEEGEFFPFEEEPMTNEDYFRISYALNERCCSLASEEEHFSFGNLTKILQAYIILFKTQVIKVKQNTWSYTLYSLFSKTRPYENSLAINRKDIEDILEKSLRVECLQNKFIIYRGSCFTNDDINDTGTKRRSLSYGSSLFAGCVYDIGATAFNYMREESNHAAAFVFDEEMLKRNVIHLPDQPHLIQFFGKGEFFHPRTKVPKEMGMERISGINMLWLPIDGSPEPGFRHPPCCYTDLSADALDQVFQSFKALAISLK